VTPAQLSRTVLDTVRRAVEDGALDVAAGGLPEHVVVESPPRRGHGDYALNVAFRLAGGGSPGGCAGSGTPAHEVARVLGDRLREQPGIGGVRVEGGGFLNVTLDAAGRAALLSELTRRRFPATPDDPAADIARWSAATGDDPPALAVRTLRSSGLFRVQYAHARTYAILRSARELGLWDGHRRGTGAGPYVRAEPEHEPEPGPLAESEPESGPASGWEPEYEPEPAARALLALLADHARLAERAADAGTGARRTPGAEVRLRHARHLEAIASAFFDVYEQCPPLPCGDEKPSAAHRARLALVEATGAVLAGGLSQLGVTAPAHL